MNHITRFIQVDNLSAVSAGQYVSQGCPIWDPQDSLRLTSCDTPVPVHCNSAHFTLKKRHFTVHRFYNVHSEHYTVHSTPDIAIHRVSFASRSEEFISLFVGLWGGTRPLMSPIMTGKRQIITPVTFFIVTVAIDEHGDDKVQFYSGKKIGIVWWLVIHYESLALGHNTIARN